MNDKFKQVRILVYINFFLEFNIFELNSEDKY